MSDAPEASSITVTARSSVSREMRRNTRRDTMMPAKAAGTATAAAIQTRGSSSTPVTKKGKHPQRDARHGGEAQRGAELLLGEPALRKVDRIRRAAGTEKRAGDTAGEARRPCPVRGDDARAQAPHQAVQREREHEHAEEQHARGPGQVDERGHSHRGAGEDHRHQAAPFGGHRLARVLEPHAERAHEVGEREEREREGQRHEVTRERDRDQRRAEAGEAEDERARERDRPQGGELGRVHQAPRTRLAPSVRFIERSRLRYFVNGRPRRASSRPARRRSSSHSSLGGSPFRAKAAMFWSYSARIETTAPPNALSSRRMYCEKRGSSSMKFTTSTPRGSSARNAAS